jgi:hypothetical protein
MFILLPPVVTYRGSELIRGDPLHWAILRTEWTALVFGRWVADIHFRGLLWQLPRKVHYWINQLGISVLFKGSPLSLDEVHALLAVHDAVEWTQYEVVVSDSRPEDGIVKIRVAPIVYNRGKVTLEYLIETSIPRIPVVTLSNPTASHSSWRPQSMAENRPPPCPCCDRRLRLSWAPTTRGVQRFRLARSPLRLSSTTIRMPWPRFLYLRRVRGRCLTRICPPRGNFPVNPVRGD